MLQRYQILKFFEKYNLPEQLIPELTEMLYIAYNDEAVSTALCTAIIDASKSPRERVDDTLQELKEQNKIAPVINLRPKQ